MSSRIVSILLVGTALLVPASLARAEEIVLKNGSRMVGEIVRQDDRKVTLRSSLGTVTVPRSRIAEIRRGGRARPNRKPVDPQLTELREVAAKAGGSSQGGQLVYDIYRLNSEIELARPREKVRLAKERRGYVRQLVAAIERQGQQ